MDIIKYNNNNYRNQVDLERIVIQTKWKTDFYKADNYNKDKQCKITIIKWIKILLFFNNNKISNYHLNLCKMHNLIWLEWISNKIIYKLRG